MARKVEVGDLILTAWTDLAEVLEINAGKYGYKAVRIRYVSRPPLPETPEDWIESEHVMIRLMTRTQMRALLEKAVADESLEKEMRETLPDVLRQPDDQLMEAARMLFLKLHEAGALIPMLVKEGYLKEPSTGGTAVQARKPNSPDSEPETPSEAVG